MYIKKIFVESFGKLEKLTLDFSSGLNVIYGKNELGKSSIAAFIKYMLYGFSHANKKNVAENDKKHYLSWRTSECSGYMDIEHNGIKYKIVRKTTQKSEEAILYDMDKGEKVNVKGEIGEHLLGVPYETYASCTQSLQNDGLSVGGSVLSQQLSNILFSADEDISSKKALAALEKERTALKHKIGKDGKLWELSEQKETLVYEFEKAKKENSEYIALRSLQEKLTDQLQKNAEVAKESEEEYENFKLYEKTALLDELEKLKKETLEKKKYAESLCEKLHKPWNKDSSTELGIIAGEIRAGENALKEAKTRCFALEEEGRDFEDIHDREILSKDLKKTKRLKKARKAFTALTVISLLCATAFAVLGYMRNKTAYIIAAILALFAILFFVLNISKKKALKKLRIRYKDEDIEEIAEKMFDIAKRRQEHEKEKASAAFYESECRGRYKTAQDKAREYFEDKALEGRELFEKIIYEQNKLKVCDDAWSKVEVSALAVKRLMESADFEYLKKIKETVSPPKKTMAQIKRESDFLQNKQKVLSSQLHECQTKLEVLKATAKEPAEIHAKLMEVEEALESENRRFEALELAIKALTDAGDTLRQGVSPKIAEHAKELLEKASHGKYGLIIADKEMSLQLEIDGVPKSIDYLSSGTKDLVYVAFRYGLAKLLFSDELPTLIFDDSFGRIDDERLEKLLSLLGEISKNTQIMIFTCHKRESEMLSEHEFNNIIL